MLITISNTPINENTVMVSFGDAISADTAMFRSCRFSLPASRAYLTGNKKIVIVGIETPVYVKVFLENIAWIHGSSKVEKDVWTDHNEDDQYLQF